MFGISHEQAAVCSVKCKKHVLHIIFLHSIMHDERNQFCRSHLVEIVA